MSDDRQPRSILRSILPILRDARDRSISQQLEAVSPSIIAGICDEVPSVSDDKLLFKKKDINSTTDHIARIFRMILFKHRITPDVYEDRTRVYGKHIGKTPAQSATLLSNAYKAIANQSLSTMQLERNLMFLGWKLENVSITIQNTRTGKIETHAITDIPELFDHGIDMEDPPYRATEDDDL